MTLTACASWPASVLLAPKDGYKAKNTIDLVITPNMLGYQQPQQVAIAAGDGASSATAPARKVKQRRQ